MTPFPAHFSRADPPSPACRPCGVLIVGGGSAGITLASLLRRRRPELAVTILEPSGDHWYQPGWTLVGGGLMQVGQTRRDEASLIPAGVEWVRSAAVSFDPGGNRVVTAAGEILTYRVLVVATGLQCRWERIRGLPTALGSHGVCSIYSHRWAPYTWETIRGFQGGTAIFTVPETAIKCGAAPQKVMYLADDLFKRRSGVGVNTRVIFCTAGRRLFSVPAYARVMERVIRERGIEVRFAHTLREVHAAEQVAVFEVATGAGASRLEEMPFSMLHAVPPMTAPEVVADSPLAGPDPGGWVEVDAHTTQHVRFPDVFALGDVAGLPTSRTAGAARAEAPVTAANLLAFLDGTPPPARYDGYTVCPLVTGIGKVVMAESDYSQKPVSSFLVDPTRERWSLWLLKTRVLPWLYWNRMLPGFPHEGRFLRPLAPLVHALRLDYREPAGGEESLEGPSDRCS
jgi:sulfide:quinone oxidoreductase